MKVYQILYISVYLSFFGECFQILLVTSIHTVDDGADTVAADLDEVQWIGAKILVRFHGSCCPSVPPHSITLTATSSITSVFIFV